MQAVAWARAIRYAAVRRCSERGRAMVRMGAVWDSTAQVLAGRGATIARVAMLTMFLPSVIQAALPLLFGANGGSRMLDIIVGLSVFVLAVLGTLAVTALASDPAVDEGRAYRAARDVLPVAIGVVLVIGFVLALLMLPGVILLVASGFDPAAMEAGRAQPTLAPGPALGSAVYFIVYALFVLWAVARLLPVYAVLIVERRGFGALRRTFALTRGRGLRIMAVLILYGIVVLVAWSAATTVVGLVFRLLVGADQAALVGFAAGVAGAVVTTALGVLQPVFGARLYAAIVGERDAPVLP